MRLIVLSDLLGDHDIHWINAYLDRLKHQFDIQFYDSRELAEIDSKIVDIDQIHKQFIEGGIEKAVKNLLLKEKAEISIIGFSIGGLIAWKATLLGLNANYICAISSTRLRYESQKPSTQIDLFLAAKDPFIPKEKWFESMKLNPSIIENETHEFYKKQEFAKLICDKITERN